MAVSRGSEAGETGPEVVGNLLFHAHQLARAAANEAMRPYEVELRHLALMGYLAEHGPCSQRQLGAAAGVDKSTLVRAIDELERRGLLARGQSVRDRRVNAITVTDLGMERMRAASERAGKVMTDLLGGLSPAERRQLTDLLTRFVEHARRVSTQSA